MVEILKIVWDAVILRDGIRKGQLGWPKFLFAAGFAVLEYAIGVPATLLYVKHSQYKPLFIAAMILVVANLVGFIWIALRWRSQQSTE